MNKFISGIIIATCLLTATVTNALPQPTLQMQIISDQINLTKQSFKSIQIVDKGKNLVSIQIELTPAAATQLQELTAKNINRVSSIVWQGYILSAAVIRSPLGAKFELTGIDRQQAQKLATAMES